MLLLLLVGLFSAASPQSFKAAHLHHRSPISSSRTSRHLNRSRANGSSRTSADAEIEPELASAPSIAVSSREHVATATREHAQQFAACVPVTRTIFAPMVCVSCIAQDDPTIALSAPPLPHLGRAPPLA
jgi:hypothetical protein